MAYVWSVVAVVVALLAAAAVVAALLGPLRRLQTVQGAAATSISDGVGLLQARLAALKVRFAERRVADAPRGDRTDRGGNTP